MRVRTMLCLLVACLCIPAGGRAAESSAILSRHDLQTIQPAYEAFLGEMADLLIEQNLLTPEDRGHWIDVQLGDYLQNGGYGTVATMYNPGVVDQADAEMTLCRMLTPVPPGTLRVDTLRSYVLQSSVMPGLPLEASVTDAHGAPVECRFRFSATSGLFTVWNNTNNTTVFTGAVCVSDGRPIYWQEDPAGSSEETIRVEVLAQDKDTVIATASFRVQAGDQRWIVLPDTFQ